MPRIGHNEWADSIEARLGEDSGAPGPLRQLFARSGRRWVPLVIGAAAVAYPLLLHSEFLVRVGVNVLLLMMLALGLNIVVGWTGLLDLGYVAYYGMGAYGYAFLASNQFGIHLPTLAVIGIVVIAMGFVGYLLGLPTRRLSGDYLAILTLFFLQVFVELTLNLDRLRLPFLGRTLSITGGPNGIAGVDPMRILGLHFQRVSDYYFLLLGLIIVMISGLVRLERSRTGRAWMAIREDPLAAEHMTVPVARMKVMAYAIGAAVAGLTGTVFAAVQTGVFPQNFTVTLLIVVYAALILGGSGSIAGAVFGAVVIGAIPEILRIPGGGRVLFYGALLAGGLIWLRPRWRLVAVGVGTFAFGLGVRLMTVSWWPDVIVVPQDGSGVGGLFGRWMVQLVPAKLWVANLAFVLLVVLVLTAVISIEPWRTVILIPMLYLAVFVWENRLVTEPSITRQLIFGVLLVVMMAIRPQGLLGKPRVEIV